MFEYHESIRSVDANNTNLAVYFLIKITANLKYEKWFKIG